MTRNDIIKEKPQRRGVMLGTGENTPSGQDEHGSTGHVRSGQHKQLNKIKIKVLMREVLIMLMRAKLKSQA